jgi:hypothetical protein
MRRFRLRSIAGALGLAVLAIAPLPNARAHHVPSGPDHQATEKDFAVEHFSVDSINVDNQFLPVPPGTTFTLTGTVGNSAHQVIFTVTELTKVVNGVRTQVLWDRDFNEGALLEEELAFWAQDDFGNVWLFGEYPEEHAEDGTVSAPSTWLAGIQEAAAGILMRSNPKLNTPPYKQGEAPAVEFLDVAEVFAVDQQTCVPTGCYEGVLVIDEHDPNQQPQDGHQFKYHAPGVGIIQVAARGGEDPETLVATEHRTLTPEELTEANARALELDRRAYTMVPEVYGQTEPAVLRCEIPAPGTPPVVGPPAPRPPNAPPPLCPPPVPTPPTEVPPGNPPAGRPERSRPTGEGRQRSPQLFSAQRR